MFDLDMSKGRFHPQAPQPNSLRFAPVWKACFARAAIRSGVDSGTGALWFVAWDLDAGRSARLLGFAWFLFCATCSSPLKRRSVIPAGPPASIRKVESKQGFIWLVVASFHLGKRLDGRTAG